MTRERYSQWMSVWKWFQRQKRSAELEILCGMLNDLWQEDRRSGTPEQIENDPELQKFLQDLDRAFAKDSESIRVARVRQLFQMHHPGNPTGTDVLVFLEWLRQQHPDLLPKEKPYQRLKLDLAGLYVD
jgi:hypothetical protein